MADTDLKKALKECQNSAKEGFQIASTQEKILSKTLESAQDNVNRVIMDFNTSPCVKELLKLLISIVRYQPRPTIVVRGYIK